MYKARRKLKWIWCIKQTDLIFNSIKNGRKSKIWLYDFDIKHITRVKFAKQLSSIHNIIPRNTN
jgi:hypothetical protein